jgi:hypothetical protein
LESKQLALRLACNLKSGFPIAATKIALVANLAAVNEGYHSKVGWLTEVMSGGCNGFCYEKG